MFGLGKPTLPVTDEDRQWVDASFTQLSNLLGRRRLLEARVMTPTAEDFPDRFDGSYTALQAMYHRIAKQMQVDTGLIDLELFSDNVQDFLKEVPFAERKSSGAGGFYQERDDGRMVVAIKQSQLGNPMALVATLADELGHVILLGGRMMERDAERMEPLNDLLMVFLGFGVFSANSAVQFGQFTSTYSQGWSVRRLGYLPEEVWGYALARFAWERGERDPKWAKHLTTNARSYLKQSMKWLQTHEKKYETPPTQI